MIQNPKINFSDRDTISLKDNSSNSHFFSQPKISPKNLDSRFRPKQGSLWQSQKTNHNLGYRGPIWVIQNPNINFTTLSTIVMQDTSPNYLFFSTENQSQNLDTNS